MKKFRQIISLVISLVKTLLSRNFYQKCVKVNFRNYHTVRFMGSDSTSMKLWEKHKIWEIFRESNIFAKEIINELISQFFSPLAETFSFFHTTLWKVKFIMMFNSLSFWGFFVSKLPQ